MLGIIWVACATSVDGVVSPGVDTAAQPVGSVRAVHLAAEFDPVDVYAGDLLVGHGLGTLTASEEVAVPLGTHSLRVTPAGGAEPLVDETVDVREGARVTVALVDGPGMDVAVDSLDNLDVAHVRYRVAHLGLAPLAVLAAGRAWDLAPGGAVTFDLPADPGTLGLDLDGDGVADQFFPIDDRPRSLVDLYLVREEPLLLSFDADGRLAIVPRIE